jgi:nitrogen fixation NifU-like protein
VNSCDELYQQTILDYNRSPRNFRKMESATHVAHGINPLCGDDYFVYLNVDEQDVIQEASFEGHGCAISKASASMMTIALVGKSLGEAQVLFETFHHMITDGRETSPDLGKLNVFSGVWKFPERVKCAALAWRAMESAIKGRKTASTE